MPDQSTQFRIRHQNASAFLSTLSSNIRSVAKRNANRTRWTIENHSERSSSLLHDLRQPRVVALSRIHQVGVDSSTHIARIFGHCDLHGIRCHHGRLWCDSSNRWSATSRIIQCNGVPLCRQCSVTRSSLRKSLLVKAIGRSVFIVRLRWNRYSFISASFLKRGITTASRSRQGRRKGWRRSSWL